MTEGLFSAVELPQTGKPGYRLDRIEVFNWGTFDKRVWDLSLNGETSLLTGDIGSGKSTMVDAVSTLLLPAQTIEYNKAAGAGRRERTLRSYVEGHYKSERNEETGASRPVPLRKDKSYSVILGIFTNEGYHETVTIAQIFQQRESSGQPWRRFVTAPTRLTIQEHFTDFGTDINALLRRLREHGAQVEDNFPKYSRQMRRLLGIRSEQAMALFHQTVSMKAVGDLNEFVRTHMLEPRETSERVSAIIDHFEDLTRTYEAVQRAQEQLEALTPLVETAQKYDDARSRHDALAAQREAVRLFFAEQRIALLGAQIAEGQQRAAVLDREVAKGERRGAALSATHDELIAAEARAGGDRLTALRTEIEQARSQETTRRRQRERFIAKVEDATLDPVENAEQFNRLPGLVTARSGEVEATAHQLESQRSSLEIDQGLLDRESAETRRELESLLGRRTNLPGNVLEIRRRLCAELNLGEDQLPFAGELIDVAPEHQQWRGAAERVLHGFALSMLVPQRLYAEVAEWVNATRLTAQRADGKVTGLRLVYERVPDRQVKLQPAQAPGLLLAHTIEVTDTVFAEYLRHQLHSRADHLCADTLDEFRGAHRAVTREGQVRSGDRHEKDDRKRIDDPRAWVLGWANERKQDAVRQELEAQQARWQQLTADLREVQNQLTTVRREGTALGALGDYTDWDDLDWETARDRAEQAEAERKRLEEGSSELAEIKRRLSANETERAENDAKVKQFTGELHTVQAQITQAEQALGREQTLVSDIEELELIRLRGSYPGIQKRLPKKPLDSMAEAVDAERETAEGIGKAVDSVQQQINGFSLNLQNSMKDIRGRWPEETTEMDASLAALDEYRDFHQRVKDNDLPRFRTEFKEQLNTNAIRELAAFSSWLRRQADDIDVRISTINEALGAIDFSQGRYIRLEKTPTVNQAIRQFRADLRAVTDDSLAEGDDQYSEQRFIEVRGIIERFKGRDGHADADKAWTALVTDVRNWFSFSASERDRNTGEEWEHYRDSDGKSGGQKEKLAYTILAASLAYQFGLTWGAERSKDFRFAVIDEAFGRGSDTSTRYALELFRKLGLQLLIVTPLQKVHVIAPYVENIGFVDNLEGSYSRVLTMTTEQYYQMQGDGQR